MRRRSSRPFFSRNWKLAVHFGVSFRSGETSTEINGAFPYTFGNVYREETGDDKGDFHRRVMGQRVVFDEQRLEVGQTYTLRVYPKLRPEDRGGWKDKPRYHQSKLLHIFNRRQPLEKYLQADEHGPWLKVQEIKEGFVQILHFERLIVMVWRTEISWVRLHLYSGKAKRLLKKLEKLKEEEVA